MCWSVDRSCVAPYLHLQAENFDFWRHLFCCLLAGFDNFCCLDFLRKTLCHVLAAEISNTVWANIRHGNYFGVDRSAFKLYHTIRVTGFCFQAGLFLVLGDIHLYSHIHHLRLYCWHLENISTTPTFVFNTTKQSVKKPTLDKDLDVYISSCFAFVDPYNYYEHIRSYQRLSEQKRLLPGNPFKCV